MASAPSHAELFYPRHKRFVKGNGWELLSLCLSPDGKMIASGFHYNGKTYMDVYSSSRDKPTIVYSRESKKYSDRPYQYVSCHDSNSSVIICCVSDKLEVLELKLPTSKILKALTVDGQIRSVAVMDGETFLSMSGSNMVYVFDRNFEQTKPIKLEGIEEEECPCDITVVKDRIFVITIARGFGNRALSYGKSKGNILTEFHNTIRQRPYAQSIAVSVKSGLVLVLWNWDQIIAYPFSENKALLVFDLRNNIRRIRISEAGYLVCGSIAGEIRLYYLEQLFSFEAMKQTLAYIVSSEECEKLRKYFRVTEEEIKRLETSVEDKELSDEEKTVRKMECLLTVIEEKGYLNPYDVNKLTDAVSKLGDKKRNSDLKGPIKGYSLHSKNIKIIMTEMMVQQEAWEDERNQLNDKLETAESKVKEHAETLKGIQGQLVQAREQETRLKKDLKDGEHKITVLEEEKMTLAEGLQQIKTLTQELKQTDQSKTARQIETLTEELKQVKGKSHKMIETLTIELNETKQRLLPRKKELETTNKDMELTKQTLKKTTHDRDNTITELTQYQYDFSKEPNALKEVLNQAKEAMAELQKRSVEDNCLPDLKETRDKDDAILEVEFGRLTAAIAEQLTLDDCIKLASFCNIPVSDLCHTVLRVSMIESPGMKFLDVLRKQNVINMFDVINLQKALAMLHLKAVNRDLVAPYQEKVDKEQYELYKVEEMRTWEEIDAFVNVAKYVSVQSQIRDGQPSPVDDTESEYPSQTEAAAQLPETGEEGRRSLLEGRHHQQFYTEHTIGREGGTIQLASVSLKVPPDALHENHVIALSVMNESPFPLDREVDTARMTPLIKLEPLGLRFKKPLQLNIPHSALISEPENHDVIIYSGQIKKNDEDSSVCIRWTEERSIPRQLKEKSVTVDIQCLTYLSASLVSQTSSPRLYIVRAVTFVDGVRNPNDDIILTICFCSDNDSEYNMLLSDYKTKLPLEQYSTIQLCRRPERDEDDARFLSVIVTSCNSTYVPDADQAVKQFSIPHLCTASRVFHQLRLQKNREVDRDDVQVSLIFSQTGSTQTEIFMKARIKDLTISQESEDLLIGAVSTALKPYDELKSKISSMLEKHHCIKLATYFDLTPAEAESVKMDALPGKILMKILDEREKIMPRKMFGLYQGLKDCHLDKIARLVFKYIEKNSYESRQEKQERDGQMCFSNFRKCFSFSTTISKTAGIMRYMLPMFVDAILQTQRGVFTLPREFKN